MGAGEKAQRLIATGKNREHGALPAQSRAEPRLDPLVSLLPAAAGAYLLNEQAWAKNPGSATEVV